VVENLAFHLEEPRDAIVGVFPYGNLGHQVTRFLAEDGGRTLVDRAAERLGARGLTRWSPSERRAFADWAPVVLLLPGLGRWGRRSKERLTALIRAKGGPHEAEYVRLSNAHAPFRRALVRLCESWDEDRS
jgi:hypothetical protein